MISKIEKYDASSYRFKYYNNAWECELRSTDELMMKKVRKFFYILFPEIDIMNLYNPGF